MKTRHCLFSLLTTVGLVSVAFGQVGVQDEAGRLVLRNEQSTMVLDKDAGGAIVSLVDHATGRELVARDPASPLFRLGLSRPGDASGELIWLTSHDAEDVAYAVEERGSSKVARLTFKKLSGRRLNADCTVSISPENGNLLWQLALEGPETLVLERVEFPSVVLRAPSRGGCRRCLCGRFGQGRRLPTAEPVACGQRRRSSQSTGPIGGPVRVLLPRFLRFLFRHAGQSRLSEAAPFQADRVRYPVRLGTVLLP